MRTIWFFLFLTGPLFATPGLTAELRLVGTYQGENLYVRNPYLIEKKVHCTQAVYVNGTLSVSDIKKSAFEIDLSHLGEGVPVEVRIEHMRGCQPRVVNPQAIQGKRALQFSACAVDSLNMVWQVSGETGPTTYFVERNVRGQWTTVSSPVITREPQTQADYELEVKHATGRNRYRVKAYTDGGEEFFSEEVEFMNGEPAVEWSFDALPQGRITLSRKAFYQVLDPYGDVMIEGEQTDIDVGKLEAGTYFLQVDDQTVPFEKRQ